MILGTLPNGEDVVVEAGSCIALATFEPLRRIQYNLLHARLRHEAVPLAAAAIDPGGEVAANAAIAILNSNDFGASVEVPEYAEG